MVFATGTLGEIGVAPGHSPLLTGLLPGPVRVASGSEEDTFFCSGGFIEVSLMSSLFYQMLPKEADDLDEAKALKAQEEAEQELANQTDDVDYARAAAQLAEAAARLKTIQKLRKNK